MKLLPPIYIILLNLLIRESSAGIFDFLGGSKLGKSLFINKNTNSSRHDTENSKLVEVKNNSLQDISSNNQKIDGTSNESFKVKTFDFSAVTPDEMYNEGLKLEMLNEFVDSYFEESNGNGNTAPYERVTKDDNQNLRSSERLAEDQKLRNGKHFLQSPTEPIKEISQSVTKKPSDFYEIPKKTGLNNHKLQKLAGSSNSEKKQEAYFNKESMAEKLLSNKNQKIPNYSSQGEQRKASAKLDIKTQKLPKYDHLRQNNNNLKEVGKKFKAVKDSESLKVPENNKHFKSSKQKIVDPWNIQNDDDISIDSKIVDNQIIASDDIHESLIQKREDIEEEEDKDCMPQNLDEFIHISNFDNNHITVKYFKENEVDSILNIQKRSNGETEVDVQSNLEGNRKSEPSKYNHKSSKRFNKQQTNLQKAEKAKETFRMEDRNYYKPEKTSPKEGNRKFRSEIKIVNGRTFAPTNSNNKISKERIGKKRGARKNSGNQWKDIPQNMWPYALTDEDNYFSSVTDFSEFSKKEWKENIFYDSKDETIDWAQYDDCDTYEDDYDDLESIKGFVHDKLNDLHQEQKRIIGEIINILYHLNDGKHKGIKVLFEALGMITDEAFLVLKTLIVSIHRLTEAGFDGITLILQCIIEGENMILTQFEDDCTCECDCSQKRGRILNHLNLLFFFRPSRTTTYKSVEIVDHLKQIFGIYENPGECWCDCYCDDRKGNFFKAYSLTDIDMESSPFMINAFYQLNQENVGTSNLSNVVNLVNLHKKKRTRHSKQTLEKRKVNSDIIGEKGFNVTTNNEKHNFSKIDVQHNKTNETSLLNVESFASRSGINYFVFLIQLMFPIFFYNAL